MTDMSIIGIAFSSLGLFLTAWALWYARVQSQKLSNAHRDEMISLWAHCDRIQTLLMQIEQITSNEGFIADGTLSPYQKQILPQIFKGLCDEFVRVAELIVKKNPNISVEDVETLEKNRKIKSDWQKQQFLNLVIGYSFHNKR